MLKNWQEEFMGFKDFVYLHPNEVQIREGRVSIKENIRLEFWRQLRVIVISFAEQKFPELITEARLLSKHYLKTEYDLAKTMMFNTTSTVSELSSFLHNPDGVIEKRLFELVLDLLRNRIDFHTFEFNASRDIGASFGSLCRRGYEKWVLFSLVRLLKSDASFIVPLRKPTLAELFMLIASDHKESVPTPQKHRLSISEYKTKPIFTIPEILVHSTKLNRYLAFRSDITSAILSAVNTHCKMEWYVLDSLLGSKIQEPLDVWGVGLTLLYIADTPDQISLVADAKRICRPDLMLECREQLGWYGLDEIKRINRHHESLRPRLGTCVVSRGKVPHRVYSQFDEDIHIIDVGFDSAKLNPIISLLT